MSLVSQSELNVLPYEELAELLWKITRTHKVKNVDWGNEITSMRDLEAQAAIPELQMDWDSLESDDVDSLRLEMQAMYVKEVKKEPVAKKEKAAKKGRSESGKKSREEDPDDLETWKVDTLKAEAKRRGVKTGKMNRAELVEALKEGDGDKAEAAPAAEKTYKERTLVDLKKLCKERDIKSYTGKNKEWLVTQLTNWDATRSGPQEAEAETEAADEPEAEPEAETEAADAEEEEKPKKKKRVRTPKPTAKEPVSEEPTGSDEDEKPSPMNWAKVLEDKEEGEVEEEE